LVKHISRKVADRDNAELHFDNLKLGLALGAYRALEELFPRYLAAMAKDRIAGAAMICGCECRRSGSFAPARKEVE